MFSIVRDKWLHYLEIWPPDGTTNISSKFEDKVVSPTKTLNLATSWLHRQLQILPPGGATNIGSKFDPREHHKQKFRIWPPGSTTNKTRTKWGEKAFAKRSQNYKYTYVLES